MAVYFYYGEEDFNIDLQIESMRSKLNPDFLSMSFQTLDNPEYPALMSALRTQPMMFGNMLAVINADKYFLSQKNFFEDSELEDIETSLKNIPEAVDIIFVCKLPRGEGKKLDSRRKLYKILTKYEAVEFQPFKSYKTADISAWIKQRAKKKDLTLQDDAIELLIDQIGTNLREFDAELDKLKLMAYPEKKVTIKMVRDISISNQDLFNLTELIMQNKKDGALLEFKKLTDKKHPLELLSAIQTILKKWIIIKTKATAPSSELARLTGMPDFVVKQNIIKLKNVKIADLVALKQNLFEAEVRIKAAQSTDVLSEVEIALIK